MANRRQPTTDNRPLTTNHFLRRYWLTVLILLITIALAYWTYLGYQNLSQSLQLLGSPASSLILPPLPLFLALPLGLRL